MSLSAGTRSRGRKKAIVYFGHEGEDNQERWITVNKIRQAIFILEQYYLSLGNKINGLNPRPPAHIRLEIFERSVDIADVLMTHLRNDYLRVESKMETIYNPAEELSNVGLLVNDNSPEFIIEIYKEALRNAGLPIFD